jgi:hypothetical protein
LGYTQSMTAAVQKIVEEVKALSAAEQGELKQALEIIPNDQITIANEQEVLRRLVAQGSVTPAQRAPHKARPVPITGQPVSEIIIADRR